MSSVIRRSETIPASGRLVLGPGNFFFLFSSAVNVSVVFERGGSTFGGDSVPAGYIKRNVEEWNRLTISGAAATALVFYYGTEQIAEDDTDIRTSIATLSGVTAVAETASDTFTSTASAALAAASSLDISANASRRRISICNESVSGTSVWVRDQAATANAGVELQPGTTMEFQTKAALRVRNNGAVAANISTAEET